MKSKQINLGDDRTAILTDKHAVIREEPKRGFHHGISIPYGDLEEILVQAYQPDSIPDQ